eukprot:scaffold20851_cov60-Phaeocystis_antarctica.AAC.3
MVRVEEHAACRRPVPPGAAPLLRQRSMVESDPCYLPLASLLITYCLLLPTSCFLLPTSYFTAASYFILTACYLLTRTYLRERHDRVRHRPVHHQPHVRLVHAHACARVRGRGRVRAMPVRAMPAWQTQPSAGWHSGGSTQRQIMPGAAPSLGQASRWGRAGPAYRPCYG